MTGAGGPWRVLLLGGASGVGKSTLGAVMARYYEVNIAALDDIQVALERLSTPEQQPLLHFWRTHWDEFTSWSEAQHLAHFRQLSAEVFAPALEAVIAHHLESGTPVILEGDFILPELATRARYDDEPNAGRVRALFVYEEEEARIAGNYERRDGEAQPFRARLSWVNARWLRSECERLGVPWVAARPWDTALERSVAALA